MVPEWQYLLQMWAHEEAVVAVLLCAFQVLEPDLLLTQPVAVRFRRVKTARYI